MTNDQLYKGVVHAVQGGFAATTCLYSGLRCCHKDRSRRHIVNFVVYGLLWGFETYQTWLHWHQEDSSALQDL